jgi:hypothetical protein
MREKLNDNPVAQIAVIGVLALIVGVFLLKGMGGGESSEGEAEAPAVEVEAGGTEEAVPGSALEGAAPAASATSVSAPSERYLPDGVEAAHARGDTIVLLIFRPGGIDDRRVANAVGVVEKMAGASLFSAPAGEIASYAPITGPLGVNQAPALIVVSPRSVSEGQAAPATVTYGFQGAAEVRQAVIDAGYRGPQLTYAPK